ncbi:MAG: DUF3352 domain-containing protein, partial [Pyrinomonadaceae bacterium]
AQQPASRRPEPDLSFEEILAADAYTVYAELRRVGTLSRAEEVKTTVASLKLLGGEEVRPLTDFYDFIAANAEAFAESSIVMAFMPARRGVPQGVVAFELESPEAAVAFEPKLRRIIGEQVRQVKKAMGTQPDPPAPSAQPGAQRGQRPTPPKKVPGSDFAIRRAGRWLVTSDGPFRLRQLRAAEGEPSLADSTRFQTVRARFSNASLFVYVDTDVAQRAWALQMQMVEEASDAVGGVNPDATSTPTPAVPGTPEEVLVGKLPATPPGADATPDPAASPEPTAEPSPEQTPEPSVEDAASAARIAEVEENLRNHEENAPPPEPTAEDRAVRGLSRIMQNLGFGVPRIPGAVALGLGLDRGALAVRLAVENTPDGTIALIPFLPNIVSGPPVTGGTAEVAPADSELFVAGSLDWTHIYNSTLGAASVNPASLMSSGGMRDDDDEEGGGKREPQPTADETVAAVEKLFGFKFKEDLLPSLGNEVALSMPLDENDFALSGVRVRAREDGREGRDAEPGPVFIASLNDPAKMREILPRVFVALGFVSPGVPQVPEKREGFEIRTLGASDGMSYAVVDSFLLVGELRAVRHCVDSYSSRRTLAGSNEYREATSWQAKQKLVQLFVSDAIVRRVVDESRTRSAGSTDASVRALLAQLEVAEYAPASYEATNEGDVVVHELRLPLSLIKSYATAAAVSIKDATVISGENSAVQTLHQLAAAQFGFKHEKKKERYGTLEELRAEGMLEKDFLTGETEYKYELNAGADKFEVTATPRNYGKTGRRSFRIDENLDVRGADHKGERATSDDPKVGP